MRFYELEDAKSKGLIQLTLWLRDKKSEQEIIQNHIDIIKRNPKREFMPVRKGGMIALFVDDVS